MTFLCRIFSKRIRIGVGLGLVFGALLAVALGERAYAELEANVLLPKQGLLLIERGIDSWLERPGEALDPRELVRQPEGQVKTTKLGYIFAPVWFRFKVENRSEREKSWVLAIRPRDISEATLYQFDPSLELIQEQSFYRSEEPSPLRLLSPYFKISLPRGESAVFLLRVSSLYNLNASLEWLSEESALRSVRHEKTILGVYLGVWGAVFLLNLALFVVTRSRSFLTYLWFSLSVGAVIGAHNGWLDQIIPSPYATSRYLGALACVAVLAGLNLERSYLRLKVTTQNLDRMTQWLMWFFAITALINVTPFFERHSGAIGYLTDAGIVFAMAFIIVTTWVVLRRGFRPALYYLASWGVLLGAVVIHFAIKYSVLRDPGLVSQFVLATGSMCEMIVLTLGLSVRFTELEREKELAERKARETDQLRALVHLICHDLRNPLTIVLAHAQARVMGSASEDWRPVLRAALQQKAILEYVRSMEALDTEKRPPKLEPVDLATAVEEAVFPFHGRIAQKRLRWVNEIPRGDSSPWVLAEPTALSHTLIGNLLLNAIKFTPEGGEIRVTCAREGDLVELIVRDTGVGIPQELLSRLFEGGTDTCRVGTAGEVGSGFGLPLAKSVASEFGGGICVESEVGPVSGTRVKVLLKSASTSS